MRAFSARLHFLVSSINIVKYLIMRNKSLLVAVILMLLPLALHAQWRVGVVEGYDFNIHAQDVHYMNDYKISGRPGLYTGVSGQYSFKKWLGVRADLIFAQKNYNLRRTDLPDVNHTYMNNYLLLPVMATFSFGGDNFPLRGFANIGEYGGFWLTSHRFGTEYNIMTNKKYEFAAPVTFNQERDNRWDMGLVGGAGMELRCNKHLSVQIEARCFYSLTSQVKEYMKVKDYRYDTTIGLQAAVYYVF